MNRKKTSKPMKPLEDTEPMLVSSSTAFYCPACGDVFVENEDRCPDCEVGLLPLGATAIANTLVKLDVFTRQYLVTAMWLTDISEEDTAAMDTKYTFDDFAPEAQAKVIEDCQKFQAAHAELIGDRHSQAGHDFWLTRNGHGAGFWEEPDWPAEAGRVLTEASEAFGECNLYVGDDGKIYC